MRRPAFKRWACALALLPVLHMPAQAQPSVAACTMIGCQQGLTLTLEGQDWPQGDYTFSMMLDDTYVTCTAKLPFNSCEEGLVSCDNENVTVGATGCALPPEQHGFHAVMVGTAPAQILLDINGPGGRRFTFDSAVETVCSKPNGEACDLDPCCSASLSAPVVWKQGRSSSAP